jgi:hypothetical protein
VLNPKIRLPIFLELEGALNLNGLVLEGRASATEPDTLQKIKFNRDGMRMVYDDPKYTTRYYAGDLIAPSFGYQNFNSMAGIGAARNFGLQPNQIIYPTKDYEFYLESKAEVKVFVNGSLVRTLLPWQQERAIFALRSRMKKAACKRFKCLFSLKGHFWRLGKQSSPIVLAFLGRLMRT